MTEDAARSAKRVVLSTGGSTSAGFATSYTDPKWDEPSQTPVVSFGTKRKMGEVVEQREEMDVGMIEPVRSIEPVELDNEENLDDVYSGSEGLPEPNYELDPSGGEMAVEIVEEDTSMMMDVESESGGDGEMDMDLESEGEDDGIVCVDPVTLTVLAGFFTRAMRDPFGVDKLYKYGVNTHAIVVRDIQEGHFNGDADQILLHVIKMFLVCGPLVSRGSKYVGAAEFVI
jgi:hypothetical protein